MKNKNHHLIDSYINSQRTTPSIFQNTNGVVSLVQNYWNHSQYDDDNKLFQSKMNLIKNPENRALTSMRTKRKNVQQKFKNLTSRLGFIKNKDIQQLKQTENIKKKFEQSQILKSKTGEYNKKMEQLIEKEKFQLFKKNYEIKTLREEQSQKKSISFQKIFFQRFKQTKNFKIRRHSDIQQYQKRRQQSLQQKRQYRDQILNLHQKQNQKKQKFVKQKKKMNRSIIQQKIILYQNQSEKIYKLIQKLKQQQQILNKKNQITTDYFDGVIIDINNIKKQQ